MMVPEPLTKHGFPHVSPACHCRRTASYLFLTPPSKATASTRLPRLRDRDVEVQARVADQIPGNVNVSGGGRQMLLQVSLEGIGLGEREDNADLGGLDLALSGGG